EPTPAPEPVRDTYPDSRPSFANDIEHEAPRRSGGGGFSLFGWKKPEQRDDGPTSFREFDLDHPAAAPQPEPEAAPPRRAHEDVVRDPALDEELEIPAFLRRQINPR
ncbi:MAG: hypothetical protein H7124_06660, partial [Phycisphaerales bacterium]|nr:hypothetical protein [Hyphomonadaceae bacterium]